MDLQDLRHTMGWNITAYQPVPGFVDRIAHCNFVDMFLQNDFTCIRPIEISVIFLQIQILQDDYHFEFS